MQGRQGLLHPGMTRSPRRTTLTAFIPADHLLSSAPQIPQRSSLISSSEEKYGLLEQRDRLLREDQKRTKLDKAGILTGTCPDMCPEKERYLREIQGQLSPFEMLPGTDKVDHTAAIKEYIRSSAGLEEVLPHELRPLAVLSMTMDYIITHIMDQGKRNYQDWYSFVWNRTHGIRKDIIYQHLHDPQTVSLMEKCARFHIHCAHQLCEEPISTFDALINKDQITKCLLTLKEMYLDLASEGTSCRREAEFQAYAILLSLHQEEVLRQVQQLQPNIRNSAEVKFAIRAFTALNSNNYVRFFKLVQTASYLNACLLHCYFSQARGKALRAVTATHTVSAQKTTGFPLNLIVRWLLFNDSREAVSFMYHYGLHVSEGYVELNRRALREPKQPFKPKRSRFILGKLKTSVGEVVNGEPLPLVPKHIPENSFSPRGKYIGDRAEMVIASCWNNIQVDMAVSPSGRRTEKRFLDPQQSESAASSSFFPFIDLELPTIKRRHGFPRLGQNEKIKGSIRQYEEEWKIENRGPKEFGWKGEDENWKDDYERRWLKMQEWEGEYSERWKGQNGNIRKDQGKEDKDGCYKQSGRMKYGRGYIQENRKREQGNEKEERAWNREYKYERIWKVLDEAPNDSICLKRHTREIKGVRKMERCYQVQLEVAERRKVIGQNQGRKIGRHQERREYHQEQEQINQKQEKENSYERRSQRDQGRVHREMLEEDSGDNIWGRKEAVEEVEKWWWNYREVEKEERKQKDMEEENEKPERQGLKRKSRDREYKYYRERNGEREFNWERGHEGRKTKEGSEKGHSHKKGQNTHWVTKKYREGKKNDNWEREYREKQGRTEERREGQWGVKKEEEKKERKARRPNFGGKKDERHVREEDRENEWYWNRKEVVGMGRNELERKEMRKKMEIENSKQPDIWERERIKCLNEERVYWERQSLPREGQKQDDQRGEDAQGLNEATSGDDYLRSLDEDWTWILDRKNGKIKYQRDHEQGENETKRRKREVWGSNYEKEWGVEDEELMDDNLEVKYGERWISDLSEKFWPREYHQDQEDNVRRKWTESAREIIFGEEQENENRQKLSKKSYREEDLEGEKTKNKYLRREGRVEENEWEQEYRREKTIDHRNNREKVEEQEWTGKDEGKEDGLTKKEGLQLKIPLKYLNVWKGENQEGLEDGSRFRWGGQMWKRNDRRENYEDEVKTTVWGKGHEKSLQEANKGVPQRMECNGNATVYPSREQSEQKQGKEKGRPREVAKRKCERMWETGDLEGLDKEIRGGRCKESQGGDHGSGPSEEDLDSEHGTQRNGEELRDNGWGREYREEKGQAQKDKNTLGIKEKDQARGIKGISEGQSAISEATLEETDEIKQELDGQEQNLRDQGKRKRSQTREEWEAEHGGEVKGEIGSKHYEGRQEEQPQRENWEIKFRSGKEREHVQNQKEYHLEGDLGKRFEKEDGRTLNVYKIMSDTRNTSEYVWEEEGWKRNEKTYTREERGGNGWETLYGRELGGEVWAREYEETLKSLRGDRREMKERECGLKQEDILDRHIIKSRKEELGNEKGKEGGKPHREFKENYKNESREKLEVNTGQKEIKWGNENQGQLGRQERQKNSGEEQEDWSKADGATHREKEIREAVAAQAWEKELCQEGSGDGFQKWPVDISERQRRKTQEEKVLRKETLKGEHGQKSLPIQPQELLIRSGENQQENDSLSEEVLTAWGSENKEEAHSASHLCELVNVTEELTHADVVGPGNGLNNEGTQMEVSQRWMRLSRSRKEILPWELQESICIAAWAPLDLPSLVMECHLVPKQKLFWKVLLILPGYDTCFARSPTRVLMDWLKVKFMGIKDPPQNGASWSNDKVETLCTLKSQRQKWNLAVDINICVKVMHGVCTKEQLHKAQTQGSLLALSGLILLLPTRRRGIGQDGYWHLARLRLSQLLRAKPSQPLVPLVILVPTDRETLGEEEAKAGLRLRDLITSRVISYFSIFRIPCYIQDLEGSNQVQEAVRWLVCYSPPVAELCCETFTHFIEKGINCEFRERLSRDQKDRQLAGLPSQEPALILELYNSVIQFLAGVMSAKQLCGPSGLAPEFFQLNDPRCLQPQGSMPEYLEWLRTITLSLQLPPIVLPQKTNWQCTCSSILKYVYHLFGSHASYPLLQCQVEHLLSQAYCHWWTKDSGEQEEPSGTEVPWDVIICLCVQQLLQNWSPPRQPGTPEAIDQQGREIQVCYFKDSLREYCLPSSWENPRLKTRNEML